MNYDILNILSVPDHGDNFEVIITEGDKDFIKLGYLVSKETKIKVPIYNDIPNFNLINDSVHPQKKVYDIWWNESHSNLVYDKTDSSRIFNSTIKIESNKFNNSKVLDLGCGNGRFSDLISEKNPEMLVLFDVSDGIHHAYKNAKKNFKNVIAIQGDILNIPIKHEYFDCVYSWGVLHHTGDTRKAFSTASSLTKFGGSLGVYVYVNNPEYKYNNTHLRFLSILRQKIIIEPLRFISQFLSKELVFALFQPIYYFEKTFNLGLVGCHGSGEDKFEKKRYFRVVIDRFKSKYATEHSIEEVTRWFVEEQFNNLEIGEGPRVCITGIKENRKLDTISLKINLK